MDHDLEDRLIRAAVAHGLIRAGDAAGLDCGAGERLQRLVTAGVLGIDEIVDLAARLPVAATVIMPRTGTDRRPEDGTGNRADTVVKLGAPEGSVPEGLPFEVVDLIGEGGMARVYRAFDPRLQRHIALKILRGIDAELVERFMREAQAQARVEHQNVCKVFEVGDREGRPYIAMQLINGVTLKEAGLEMSVEAKVGVMQRVADAVHAAHRLGLVHRDLKPTNIMVERTIGGAWRPYVLDFGLAREVAADGMTATGVVVGTPQYMSPEQASGDRRRVDRRSDVFSLGATLYELIAGRPAFDAESLLGVLCKIAESDPLPLRRHVPSVPRDLETIVRKSLEKDPGRRYPSARALAEDLQRFIDGEPLVARRSRTYRLMKRIRKHRVVASVAGVALILVVVSGALGVRSEWRARERAAEAQLAGQEVERLDGIMRLAFLLPRHDTTPERNLVRERLEELEKGGLSIDGPAAGPGLFALGKGHAALGELDRAVACLERAWRSGYREPEVAHALGRAHSRLYRRELDRIERVADPGEREARRERANRLHRAPAVHYLAQGPASRGSSPSLAEILLAFTDKRYPAALRLAEEAVAARPLDHEAAELLGLIHEAVADGLRDRGDYDRATAAYGRAERAYRMTVTTARSYTPGYVDQCRLWTHAMAAEVSRGGSIDAHLEHAVLACGQALETHPGEFEAHNHLARAYLYQAYRLMASGKDPSPALDLAESEAHASLDLEPDQNGAYWHLGMASIHRGAFDAAHGGNPEAHYQAAITSFGEALDNDPADVEALSRQAEAYWRLARHRLGRGGDPGPSLVSTIECVERVLRVGAAITDDVRARSLNTLGNAYDTLGRYRLGNGEDPSGALDKAIDAFRAALALNPNDARAASNLGVSLARRAQWIKERGDDPAPSMEQATAAFQVATRINPRSESSVNNLGNSYLDLARYQVDHGVDPRASLERALAAFRRALELRPDYVYALNNTGLAHKIRGVAERATGGDPVPHFDIAAASFRQALGIKPDHLSSLHNLGTTFLERAEHERARGLDPRGSLDSAAVALRRALEINARSLATRESLARVELERARWRLVCGADPGPALAAVEDLVDQALAIDSADAYALAIEAEACALGAIGDISAGAGPGDALARGLDAAGRALEENPRLPEALIGAARVRLAIARAPGADREAEVTAAVSLLDRALEVNPYLRVELAGDLTLAEGLRDDLGRGGGPDHRPVAQTGR